MKHTKSSGVISIVLLAAVLIVVNLLAARYFFRIDFTENGQYTISNSTKKVLKNLDDTITVKFYVSGELPPRVQPIKRDVSDLLDEYRRYGKGNVELLTLYPEKSDEIAKDAAGLGIRKVRVNVVGANKAEVQEVYMGIALFYKDKKEVLPVVMSTNNLEYLMTSTILKLTQKEKKKIVFLTNTPDYSKLDPRIRQQLMQQMPQSHSFSTDTRLVGNMIRELYDVTEKHLTKGEMIPDGTSMVVLNDLTTLSDWERYAVDQYVMKGGTLIVLTSAYAPGKNMFAQQRKINYYDWLAKYGFVVHKDMVLDLYNYAVMIPQGIFQYSVPYPLWLKVSPEQLGKSLPDAVKNIGSLGVLYASSLTHTDVNGVTFSTIMSTTKKSWTEDGLISLDPKQITPPEESQLASHDIALLAKGRFPSAFTAQNLPEGADHNTFSATSTTDATILVISSGSFLLDSTLSNFRDNAIFFANLVDYLADSDVLVAIRSRSGGIHYINPNFDESKQAVIRWLGTLLIPLLVVLYGIIRMIVRNRHTGRK